MRYKTIHFVNPFSSCISYILYKTFLMMKILNSKRCLNNINFKLCGIFPNNIWHSICVCVCVLNIYHLILFHYMYTTFFNMCVWIFFFLIHPVSSSSICLHSICILLMYIYLNEKKNKTIIYYINAPSALV